MADAGEMTPPPETLAVMLETARAEEEVCARIEAFLSDLDEGAEERADLEAMWATHHNSLCRIQTWLTTRQAAGKGAAPVPKVEKEDENEGKKDVAKADDETLQPSVTEVTRGYRAYVDWSTLVILAASIAISLYSYWDGPFYTVGFCIGGAAVFTTLHNWGNINGAA